MTEIAMLVLDRFVERDFKNKRRRPYQCCTGKVFPGKEGGDDKNAVTAKTTPTPGRRRTELYDQLYWLDLSANRTWDLRLDRPFDRAVSFEVR